MKAAQFVGKPLFEINRIARPKCPKDGLIVRVRSTAICGTDLKIMKCQDVKIENGKATSMDIPRITGHEVSGLVEEVGCEVNNFVCGDRVVVAPTIPCLNCRTCKKGYHEMCENVQVIGYHRDGGFAEFLKVDRDVLAAHCVVKLPDSVDLDSAALVEPLSCAINCLELSPVKPNDKVLIMGAGPLGLIIADLSRCFGAGMVFVADISGEQLKKAAVSNIDAAIDISKDDLEAKLCELTDGMGVDLIVTACPAPAAQHVALRVAAKRGKINFFGGLPRDISMVELDTNLIHYKELTVVGTHGSSPDHVAKAVQLLTEAKIDLSKYVEDCFPLDQINDALAMAQGQGRLKMLIKPNG